MAVATLPCFDYTLYLHESTPQRAERRRRQFVRVQNLRAARQAGCQIQAQRSIACKQVRDTNRQQEQLQLRLLQYRTRLSSPSILQSSSSRSGAHSAPVPRTTHSPSPPQLSKLQPQEEVTYNSQLFKRSGFGTTKDGRLNITIPRLIVTPPSREDNDSAAQQHLVLVERENNQLLNIPCHANPLEEQRVPWACRRRSDSHTWQQLVPLGDMLFMRTRLQPTCSLRLSDVMASQLRIYDASSKLGIAFVSQREPAAQAPAAAPSNPEPATAEDCPETPSLHRQPSPDRPATTKEQWATPLRRESTDLALTSRATSSSRACMRPRAMTQGVINSEELIPLRRRLNSDAGTYQRSSLLRTNRLLRRMSKPDTAGLPRSRQQVEEAKIFPLIE